MANWRDWTLWSITDTIAGWIALRGSPQRSTRILCPSTCLNRDRALGLEVKCAETKNLQATRPLALSGNMKAQAHMSKVLT